MATQIYGNGSSVLELSREGDVVEVITRPDDDLGVVVTIPLAIFDALVAEMRSRNESDPVPLDEAIRNTYRDQERIHGK